MFYPPVPKSDEIRSIRIKNGLEIYQAANLINVAPATWYSYENGTAAPSAFNWALFLNALGLLELPAVEDDGKGMGKLPVLAQRALSFVPPKAFKRGEVPADYVAPSPETIIELRTRAGITPKVCSALFGFSNPNNWHKYERGELKLLKREWTIFQVALGIIEPPPFSDFQTAREKQPMYEKKTEYFAPSSDEIRALLEKHNLTQAQAAEIIGIHPRRFRSYLNKGGDKIPEKRWLLLQAALNLKADLLENPDCEGFPVPQSETDLQEIISTLSVAGDRVAKINSRRSVELLPVQDMELALSRPKDGMQALFFRVPDYQNQHWGLWRGFSVQPDKVHNILFLLSRRYGNLNIKYLNA